MEKIPEMYASGMSIPEISDLTGVPRSTVRSRIISSGAPIRSRSEAVKDAGRKGKLGSGFRGKKRQFSPDHCESISKARKSWSSEFAAGVSLKPNGYLEYTKGEHKGRLVHVVAIEALIGRRIKRGECVHHIDEDKTNNSISNLALMTISAHTRLHRHLDKLRGKTRERRKNGQFS
jgi:hypothetical protein